MIFGPKEEKHKSFSRKVADAMDANSISSGSGDALKIALSQRNTSKVSNLANVSYSDAELMIATYKRSGRIEKPLFSTQKKPPSTTASVPGSTLRSEKIYSTQDINSRELSEKEYSAPKTAQEEESIKSSTFSGDFDDPLGLLD